jgi:nucleoside-diphosphate-sugar epimerase
MPSVPHAATLRSWYRLGPIVGTIFVTGATGFVGRAFAAELSAHDRALRAVVRGPDPAGRLASLGIRAEPRPGNVCDPASIARALQGCESVVHLAARLDPPGRGDPQARQRVNVAAAVECARLAREHGARRFVFASSVAAIGIWTGVATANSPCHPTSAYGRGKLEAERRVLSLATPDFHVLVVRMPVLYGVGDRWGLLSCVRLVDSGYAPVIGSGQNAFPLCSCENAARALRAAAEGRLGTGVYLVADAQVYSVRRIQRAIAAALGRQPPWLRIPVRVARAAAVLNDVAGQRLGLPGWLTHEHVHVLSSDRRFDIAPLRACGVELDADLEAGVQKTVEDYRRRGLLRRS